MGGRGGEIKNLDFVLCGLKLVPHHCELCVCVCV
jgi:hypothetical protein